MILLLAVAISILSAALDTQFACSWFSLALIVIARGPVRAVAAKMPNVFALASTVAHYTPPIIDAVIMEPRIDFTSAAHHRLGEK